jgi:hypothetical protein
MNQSQTEQEMLRKIALLPRELAPVNDPWPKISARISAISRDPVPIPAPGQTHLWPFAVAATALILVATALILGQPWNSSSPWNSSVSAPDAPEVAQRYPAAAASAASEAEYQAAFREFMTSGATHAAPLQPSMEAFGAGWSALRQAEVELQVALNQEPDSQFLNSHMQALRARQLELLQQISAADMAARRDTI